MGHWYDKDGNPQHFIVGANGKERASTLRDARKHKWHPSVTEILNVAAKPALTKWLVDQALLSALTLPPIEGETLDAFKKRAKSDSEQQSKDAMVIGNEIHADIEALWKGETPQKWIEIAQKAKKTVESVTGLSSGFVAERTFSSDLGYGGMIDLSCPGWVIDYKTKDFDDPTKRMAYDEHAMQLAAYAHGIGMPDAQMANIFISRNNPGLISVHVWDEKANEGTWFERFTCLLKYWQLSKNYGV